MYHIGEEIHKESKRQMYTVQQFAQRLGCSLSKTYAIFKKHDFTISELERIGEILRRDFLLEYAKSKYADDAEEM